MKCMKNMKRGTNISYSKLSKLNVKRLKDGLKGYLN